MSYVPDRGDLVWLSFTPQAGREQAGQRPALILSPKTYNRKTGLAIACPITVKTKDYPFEVALRGNGKITGTVLADQLKSVDWRARHARRAGRADAAAIKTAAAFAAALIGG